MTIKQKTDHWVMLSYTDIKAVRSEVKVKNYIIALYHGQQAIEKLFKALCTTRGISPPPIHSLIRLAQVAHYPLVQQDVVNLQTISDFNMMCRYDDLTAKFIKSCTEQYAKTWVKVIEIWYKILRAKIKQERNALPNNVHI